jgi:hypothetical protein
LKAEGLDLTHGGKAAERRGAAIAERKRQAADWEQANPGPADPELFKREILPLTQGVPLRRLLEATGLSLRYCSLIRRGERVPHPRHWEALRTWREKYPGEPLSAPPASYGFHTSSSGTHEAAVPRDSRHRRGLG